MTAPTKLYACPKCGGQHLHIRFVFETANIYVQQDGEIEFHDADDNFAGRDGWFQGTCQKCQHVWKMKMTLKDFNYNLDPNG